MRRWRLIILKVCLALPIQQNLIVFLEEIVPSISPQMNQILLRITTEEEVRQALFRMHPEIAPGPDGMTALFFQHSWHVIKKDVVEIVNNFLVTGNMDKRLYIINI